LAPRGTGYESNPDNFILAPVKFNLLICEYIEGGKSNVAILVPVISNSVNPEPSIFNVVNAGGKETLVNAEHPDIFKYTNLEGKLSEDIIVDPANVKFVIKLHPVKFKLVILDKLGKIVIDEQPNKSKLVILGKFCKDVNLVLLFSVRVCKLVGKTVPETPIPGGQINVCNVDGNTGKFIKRVHADMSKPVRPEVGNTKLLKEGLATFNKPCNPVHPAKFKLISVDGIPVIPVKYFSPDKSRVFNDVDNVNSNVCNPDGNPEIPVIPLGVDNSSNPVGNVGIEEIFGGSFSEIIPVGNVGKVVSKVHLDKSNVVNPLGNVGSEVVPGGALYVTNAEGKLVGNVVNKVHLDKSNVVNPVGNVGSKVVPGGALYVTNAEGKLVGNVVSNVQLDKSNEVIPLGKDGNVVSKVQLDKSNEVIPLGKFGNVVNLVHLDKSSVINPLGKVGSEVILGGALNTITDAGKSGKVVSKVQEDASNPVKFDGNAILVKFDPKIRVVGPIPEKFNSGILGTVQSGST